MLNGFKFIEYVPLVVIFAKNCANVLFRTFTTYEITNKIVYATIIGKLRVSSLLLHYSILIPALIIYFLSGSVMN